MTDRDLLPPLDEAELRALLDRSLAGVHAPDRLQVSALATGRRLRTRRRAGQVTGGLLAAAACAAVIVASVAGDSGTAGPGYAGDPTPTVAPSPSLAATPTPAAGDPPPPSTADDPPPGWWDMPSRRMLTVLRTVLPDGVTVAEARLRPEGATSGERSTSHLHGVLAGSAGPGTFQVLLYPPDPTEPLPEAVADGARTLAELAERIQCEAYMTTCEAVLDASGAAIGRVSTDEESGTTYHEVMLLGPNGGALYFYVADSSGEKPGYEPPSAEVPPLSTDQLVALAQDPAWTDYAPGD